MSVPPELADDLREAMQMPENLIGPYVLLDPLGEGGCGVVYRSWDTKRQREVALKVIEAPDDLARERFHREIAAARRLEHPHIVGLVDFGEDAGDLLIAFELVRGAPLHEVIEERRPGAREVARWLSDVAGALQHAHDRHVLHRDVKPHNVMIDERGRARILDFGLVRFLDAVSDLTRSGATVGTLAFMPPEQIEGGRRPLDARADVYALGATLQFALSGKPPFALGLRHEVIDRIRTEAPRPLSPDVPPALAALCGRCLQKRPGDRPATARHVREALERFLRGSLSDTRAFSTPSFDTAIESSDLGLTARPKPARWPKVAAAAGALVLLIALGATAIRALVSGDTAPPEPVSEELDLATLIQTAPPEWNRALASLPERLDERRLAPALEALRELTTALRGAERDLYLEANPASAGLERLLAAREPLTPADERLLSEAGERVRLRTRAALGPDRLPCVATLVAERQASALGETGARRWELCCALLARGSSPSSRRALEDALAAQRDPLRALHPARALGARGETDALGAALERFGWLGPFARGTRDLATPGELAAGLRAWRAGDLNTAQASLDRAVAAAPEAPLRWVARAALEIEREVYERAAADLATARRLDPTSSAAWVQQGALDLARDQPRPASVAFDQALGLDPRNPDAWLGRSRARRALDQVDRALGDVEQALRLEPGWIEARVLRGAYRYRLGDLGSALADARAALDAGADGAERTRALNLLGTALQAKGDLPGARAAFEQAVEHDALDAFGWNNLGYVQHRLGELKEALRSLDRAVDGAPEQSGFWMNRGNLLKDLDRPEDALAAFDKAIALDATSALPWLNRAVLRLEQGKTDDALSDLSRALELDPKLVLGWTHRARLHLDLRNPAQAEQDCDRALELRPGDRTALTLRARARRTLGRTVEAEADLTRALELDPENPTLWTERGHVRLTAGRQGDAVADYDRALELDPDHVDARVNRGVARQHTGDVSGALADFEAVLRIDPDSVGARVNRAVIRMKEGDPAGAEDDLNETLRRHPGQPLALLTRARLYAQQDRVERARADLEQLLAQNPPKRWARPARDLLKRLTR